LTPGSTKNNSEHPSFSTATDTISDFEKFGRQQSRRLVAIWHFLASRGAVILTVSQRSDCKDFFVCEEKKINSRLGKLLQQQPRTRQAGSTVLISQIVSKSSFETFQPQILLDYVHNRRWRNASLARYFPDCSVSLRLVFLAHNQIINKINVFFRSSTAWPATADTSVNSTSFSELLKQPVDATFRPSFVRKFCKQPASILSFQQMQTFDQYLVFVIVYKYCGDV